MSYQQKEMIFSLSSGAGRAGVSVFRISGEGAYGLGLSLSGKRKLKPRFAYFVKIKDAEAQIIDEGLLLYFPAPHSFTGEDIIECHCHGSMAVIKAMSKVLSGLGARQAEAGEFTRRAVLNGKMDLTEAEGLADLIDSETEAQRQQSLRQMQGGLSEIYGIWKEQLLDALAQIEGEIDFPTEADIPDNLSHQAYPILKSIAEEMSTLLEDSGRGQIIREGVNITLIGAPNSGKSSIINRLARNDVAIVTNEAGTTRDVLSVDMVMAGLPVTLSDTAGLRMTENHIEKEGISRAERRAVESDLRLWVLDGSNAESPQRPDQIISGDLVLINKADLTQQLGSIDDDLETLHISAVSGQGFDGLESRLETLIKTRYGMLPQAGLTRERHKDCVARAKEATVRAMDGLSIAPELVSEDIRVALQALRELAGDADIESVFDRIFSRFCVGK